MYSQTMEKIVYVTGNPRKAELAARFIDFPIEHQSLDLEEIQSLSFDEVVEHKVKEAYRQVQRPVLVGDAGVIFNALGNLPGPLVKWFIQSLSTEGLCRLLDGYADRSAVDVSCLGYYDGQSLKIVRAECVGHIAQHPRGSDQWGGWSDTFVYKETNKTWPEMTKQEQYQVSTFRAALREMQDYLKTLS